MNFQGIHTQKFSSTDTVKDVLRRFLAIKLHKTEVSEEDMMKVALVNKKQKELAFSTDSTLSNCGLENNDRVMSIVFLFSLTVSSTSQESRLSPIHFE